MGQRYRPGLTSAQKTELWDRWQRGESLTAIGRAFGVFVNLLSGVAAWRDPPLGAAALAVVLDVVGTRGDIAWHCGAVLDPLDSSVAGPRAIDGEPRG
jgi:hypothetical protein